MKIDFTDATPFSRPSGSDWEDATEDQVRTFLARVSKAADLEDPVEVMPDGYLMLQQTRKSSQTDKYVLGHPSGGRFRSANEFTPHLLFLASRGANPCLCLLCGRQSRSKSPRIQLNSGDEEVSLDNNAESALTSRPKRHKSDDTDDVMDVDKTNTGLNELSEHPANLHSIKQNLDSSGSEKISSAHSSPQSKARSMISIPLPSKSPSPKPTPRVPKSTTSISEDVPQVQQEAVGIQPSSPLIRPEALPAVPITAASTLAPAKKGSRLAKSATSNPFEPRVRTVNGTPTPPTFRVNEIVYVEVMITPIQASEPTIVFPPPASQPDAKSVSVDASSLYSDCVFWPAVVDRVFPYGGQEMLWTTPILVDTIDPSDSATAAEASSGTTSSLTGSTSKLVQLSSAACFPDNVETSSRQTKEIPAKSSSTTTPQPSSTSSLIIETVHKRPSYKINLLCLPHGSISLPEVSLVPYKLVQPPQDLFPSVSLGDGKGKPQVKLTMGHIDSAVRAGVDASICMFYRALLTAWNVAGGRSGVPPDVIGAFCGGEVINVHDYVIVKAPGLYEGILRVSAVHKRQVAGSGSGAGGVGAGNDGLMFTVDGFKCSRKTMWADEVASGQGKLNLDWIRGGKDQYKFGDKVKGIAAAQVLGRVYPQFPLVTTNSEGNLIRVSAEII